ncbi:Member of major facilitator superfamily multidrug-dha1 sub-family [Mycena kentingensis (nom. inval.)]|nr:Member of major facilitator superfamily multidrug-dha1 sub-family [Mycena kentingensis (nom. inval.)]
MMSASYKALLAISDTHTRSANEQAAAALAQKKAREEQTRKAVAAREAKEKAQKQEEIRRHFANLQKKQEEERLEQARQKKQEAEFKRREAEQRDKLVYGAKQAKERASYPTSSSGVREAVRKSRLPEDDEGRPALTREELRQRRQDNEHRRQYNEAPRRPTTSAPTSLAASGFLRKAPPGKAKSKRSGTGVGFLRGGAMNVVASANRPRPVADGPGLTAKERIAAQPNDLILLQTKKRDVRTIDEIQRDLHASKSLSGEDAKQYDGWFGPSTKSSKEGSRRPSPPTAKQPSPPERPHRPLAAARALPKASSQASTASGSSVSSNAAAQKKRPRSSAYDDYSRSATPPPAKRPKSTASSSTSKRPQHAAAKPAARYHEEEEEEEDDYEYGHNAKEAAMRDQIWALMGKNRAEYVSRDYDSDDDDMEAGASDLEREEMKSSRVARQEDRDEEAAEKRAAEEKKRRKAMAARGY